MKKISLLLVIAVLLTSFVIPISTSAAVLAERIGDNFDGYETVDDLKAVWGTKFGGQQTTADCIAIGDGQDGGKALLINKDAETKWIAKSMTSIGDNYAKMTLKIKYDYTESNFKTIFGLGSANNAGKWAPVISVIGNKLYLGTTSAEEGKYVCDVNEETWYNLELIYAVKTGECKISVSNGTSVIGTKEATAVRNGGVDYADVLRIQMWDAGTGSVAIDDLYITQEGPYISDSFDSYETVDALKAVWGTKFGGQNTTADCIAIGDGQAGGKALLINKDDATKWLAKKITPSISAKDAEMTFKIKYDYTDSAAPFKTIFGLGSANNAGKWAPVISIIGNKLYVGTSSAEEGKYVCDVNEEAWYNVKLIYTATTGNCIISVSDGTSVIGTKEATAVRNSGVDYADVLRIQMWDAGTGSVAIDDILIDDYVPSADDGEEDDEEEEETSAILLEDNFNNKSVDNIVETWKLQGGTSKDIISVGTGADGTEALEMICSTGTNYLAASFKENVVAGEIVASFKMMHDYTDSTGGTTATQTSIISLADMLSGGHYIPVLYIKNGKMYTGTNNDYDSSKYICDSVSGKWYDVEVVFNVTEMSYDIYVIDGSEVCGKSDVSVAAFSSGAAMVDVDTIRLQMWDAKEEGKYGKMILDDVAVKYSTDAIDVKATDLLFEGADGVANYYAATVPASTAKINIDFGTAMNESTLTDATVILKNETDNAVVEYVGETSGTVYTIPLSKLLVPGKDYTLTITTNVKNVNNEPAEKEAKFEFKTDNGECKINFNAFAIGENTAPTVTDILGATTAKVKMNVLNSTGKDKDLMLIIAYFNDEQLVEVIYEDYDLPYDTYVNGIFEKDITLKSGVTADMVSVFAWDTISTMKPYTTSIVVPAQ